MSSGAKWAAEQEEEFEDHIRKHTLRKGMRVVTKYSDGTEVYGNLVRINYSSWAFHIQPDEGGHDVCVSRVLPTSAPESDAAVWRRGRRAAGLPLTVRLVVMVRGELLLSTAGKLPECEIETYGDVLPSGKRLIKQVCRRANEKYLREIGAHMLPYEDRVYAYVGVVWTRKPEIIDGSYAWTSDLVGAANPHKSVSTALAFMVSALAKGAL